MLNAEIEDSTQSMGAKPSVALRHSAFIIPNSAFYNSGNTFPNCMLFDPLTSIVFPLIGLLSRY